MSRLEMIVSGQHIGAKTMDLQWSLTSDNNNQFHIQVQLKSTDHQNMLDPWCTGFYVTVLLSNYELQTFLLQTDIAVQIHSQWTVKRLVE